MTSVTTCKALENWANGKAEKWQHLMASGEFAQAARVVIAAIRECCGFSLVGTTVEFRRFHFAIRVLFNSLRDLANLKIIIADDRWLSSPQAVEYVWELLFDARDRLVGYAGLNVGFRAYWLNQVRPAFDAIQGKYGNGSYTSWELVLDGLTCSICNSDIRGCNHVPGEWYGEEECKQIPEGGYIRAVAIVENPHDPRCRIWPWDRKTGENESWMPVFILFTPEGNEDGGVVVHTDELLLSAQDASTPKPRITAQFQLAP